MYGLRVLGKLGGAGGDREEEVVRVYFVFVELYRERGGECI